MKAKYRPARLGIGLSFFMLIAVLAGGFTVQAERVSDSPKTKLVAFHVRRGLRSVSFLLANDATIRIGTNDKANLMDLRVGQMAHVHYTIQNGTWLAHEIVVNRPHGGHAAKKSANQTDALHAHGEILGYNASTGQLTIRFHH